MTTVLVVDDQFLIRAGLVGLLNAVPGIEVVGEAGDGEEAVVLAARTRPDVVLMGIRMPGMSGIEATEKILAQAPDPAPRVLVLTTFNLDEYVYGALRAGASGFLLKDSGPPRWRRSAAATRCSRGASRVGSSRPSRGRPGPPGTAANPRPTSPP
jgi:DNA-binding NarL/FixJ family response regulator